MGLPAKKNEWLQDLLLFHGELARNKELGAVFQQLVIGAVELSGAERGAIFLQEGNQLKLVAAEKFSEADFHLNHGEEIAKLIIKAIDSGEAQIYTASEKSDAKNVMELRLRSSAVVPLKIYDDISGAIYVDRSLENGALGDLEGTILTSVAQHGALVLDQVWLTSRLKAKQNELESLESELKLLGTAPKTSVSTEPAGHFRYDYSNIIGSSAPMQELFAILDKVVDADYPVLIHGESGTGKELVARSIHYNGPRQDKPFVSENCGAITPTLIESELFGHTKGSFTGADRDKPGLFQMANHGTLLLDEIGELPLNLQTKLLRVLQERRVRPIGSEEDFEIDVRIISATNKDLDQLIKEGRFREDLYYRLNLITIHVPPLRERLDDIPILVTHFLKNISEEEGRPVKQISDEALHKLKNYFWPGNIRQLENEIRKLVALCDRRIDASDLSEDILSQKDPIHRLGDKPRGSLSDVVGQVEAEVILRALDDAGGNKSEAAKVLGINRSTLYEKLNKIKKAA